MEQEGKEKENNFKQEKGWKGKEDEHE